MLNEIPRRRQRQDTPLVTEPARRILEVADPGDTGTMVLTDAGREIVEVEADDPTVLYVVEPVPLTSGVTGQLVTRDEMDAALAALEAELRAEIEALEIRIGETHDSIAFPAPVNPWLASHALGYRPAGVVAVDTTGALVWGEVTYPSLTQVSVRFSAPMAGTLYLS